MNLTLHINQRMSRRGIKKSMIEFALQHGRRNGDKVYVNRKMLKNFVKQAKARTKMLRRLKRKYKHMTVVWLITKHQDNLHKDTTIALKILDKGGIVVVHVNDYLITTYDVDSAYSY